MEAQWYLSSELVNRACSPRVIFHQLAYRQTTFTLFSYTSKDDRMLKRHHISILIDEKNAPDRETAMDLREKIITLGGNSSVVSEPEVRWKSINVVFKRPKASWRRYLVKLYSAKLLKDAMQREMFSFNDIEKYEIKQESTYLLPLNIYYISKLY